MMRRLATMVAVMGVMAAPLAAQTRDTAVVAGGCFWGIQAVFEHVHGVESAVSGYAGGARMTAHYEIVGTGATGHAESVRIVFDPSQVSYATLLKVFFASHDPTTLNRQGPDEGTQYRSNIFYRTAEQHRTADSVIAALTAAHAYRNRIVTLVTSLPGFYEAEDYHQDYAILHPDAPYIYYNDRPKVENLKRSFPDLWRETPVRVTASR